MADFFSDDVDFDIDSAFLEEVDAIEAAIEVPKPAPSTPAVSKAVPLVSRSSSVPKPSGLGAAPSTPVVPKTPAANATRPSFRPAGRSVSAATPSGTSGGIRNAVRSALTQHSSASQTSSNLDTGM